MQRFWFYPLTWLLQMVILIRHQLFDWGWIASKKGEIKTIVIGNLNIGGTGKTPFSLFLMDQLSTHYRLAFLSRGYGRKTNGIRKISITDHPNDVGDEPLLIKRKNKDIPCYVGERRVEAIHQIKQSEKGIDWIVLDDAFQHRNLIPDVAIILTRWEDLFTDDHLWPVGHLRDIKSSLKRAHAIVVTSTPNDVTHDMMNMKRKRIQCFFKGPIFFSQTIIKPIQPLFTHLPNEPIQPIGAFCGIAQPESFFKFLRRDCDIEKTKIFPDHHLFNAQDLEKLSAELVNFGGKIGSWVTTEKDAIRIQNEKQWTELPIYYLPIETRIHPEDQKEWNQWLNQQLAR